MTMSLRGILLIVALVCFLLAAFGMALGQISLVPLGLAFLAGAFLVTEGGWDRGLGGGRGIGR